MSFYISSNNQQQLQVNRKKNSLDLSGLVEANDFGGLFEMKGKTVDISENINERNAPRIR